MKGKRLLKKKIEFSKLICSATSVGLFVVGVWMVWKYYSLIEYAIQMESVSTPDASLPIAGITFIIAPIISYLTYQWGLKNSRNKYGVDENGQPYCISNE